MNLEALQYRGRPWTQEDRDLWSANAEFHRQRREAEAMLQFFCEWIP